MSWFERRASSLVGLIHGRVSPAERYEVVWADGQVSEFCFLVTAEGCARDESWGALPSTVKSIATGETLFTIATGDP